MSNLSKSPVALLAALVVLLAAILYFKQPAQPPKPAPVSPRNAFDDFVRAMTLLEAPPRDAEFNTLLTGVWTGPWTNDDRLIKYLDRNAGALAALDDGLANTNCVLPAYENPESSLAYLDSLRELARLKSLQIKRAGTGDPARSGAGVAGIVKLGDFVMRGGGPLRAYNMGIAIKHIGYDLGRHVPVTQDLAPYALDHGALLRSLDVEHASVGLWLLDAAGRPNFDAIVMAVTGGQPSSTIRNLLTGSNSYIVEETGNVMEKLFAMARDNALRSWTQRQPIESALERALREPFDLRKEPNVRGLIVLHLSLDQIPAALISQRRIEAEAAALRPTPGIDPFSDEPMHVSKERGLVWSVGPDGVDNNGEIVYSGDTPQGDLVFPLPAATR